MSIIDVIHKCINEAQEDFDKVCPEVIPDKEFSREEAMLKCTDLANNIYFPYFFKNFRAPPESFGLGRYNIFDSDKTEWCNQWVAQPEPAPEECDEDEEFYEEEDDYTINRIADKKNALEENSLSWSQWALIGGVAIGVGAAAVLSGGTGAAPAAVSGGAILQAAGVGVAAGVLTYLGFGEDTST